MRSRAVSIINSSTQSNRRRRSGRIREIAIFAMLGSLMFASKIIMEVLPNIHLLGMLTMVYTIVYRKKALIPIYIYVVLNGVYAGFSVWWIPYIYIWAILWGVTMVLPKNMPKLVASAVYPVVCCLHGFFFGVLYAPAEALFFGLTFEETIAWIATGFWFDILHMVGNFAAGFLVHPLATAMKKLAKIK